MLSSATLDIVPTQTSPLSVTVLVKLTCGLYHFPQRPQPACGPLFSNGKRSSRHLSPRPGPFFSSASRHLTVPQCYHSPGASPGGGGGGGGAAGCCGAGGCGACGAACGGGGGGAAAWGGEGGGGGGAWGAGACAAGAPGCGCGAGGLAAFACASAAAISWSIRSISWQAGASSSAVSCPFMYRL